MTVMIYVEAQNMHYTL